MSSRSRYKSTHLLGKSSRPRDSGLTATFDSIRFGSFIHVGKNLVPGRHGLIRFAPSMYREKSPSGPTPSSIRHLIYFNRGMDGQHGLPLSGRPGVPRTGGLFFDFLNSMGRNQAPLTTIERRAGQIRYQPRLFFLLTFHFSESALMSVTLSFFKTDPLITPRSFTIRLHSTLGAANF